MHIKPKKSLGQNFLVDPNIRRKIVAACEFYPCDIILEIGSGRGELTRLIADRVSKVCALEIDPQLCRMLKDASDGLANIEIINRDILKFDLTDYFRKATQRKIKVVGNIPYYISSEIIAHLLRHRAVIDKIYLTVQKEFAARVCAKPGSKDYGAFSCFAQYYAQAKVLFHIKNTSFSPVPKVDSSFLSLAITAQPQVKVNDERLFFKVIRQSFNQRRKTLRNSLRNLAPAEKLAGFFTSRNLGSNIRPEQLSLSDFADLANCL